jgi:hypothetical protein
MFVSHPTIDAVRTTHRILRNHEFYRVFKRVTYYFTTKHTKGYIFRVLRGEIFGVNVMEYRVRGGRSLRLPTEPCVRVRTRLLTKVAPSDEAQTNAITVCPNG